MTNDQDAIICMCLVICDEMLVIYDLLLEVCVILCELHMMYIMVEGCDYSLSLRLIVDILCF